MEHKRQLPRCKLQQNGIRSLSDVELIATLINSGTKEQPLFELANAVMEKAYGSIYGLSKLGLDDLKKVPGIGHSKAAAILTALELGRRHQEADTPPKPKISSSEDIFNHFSFLGDLPHEEFWILILKRNNAVIDKFQISKGGVSGTLVDVRLILKKAIDALASVIILCHNHPSGDTRPSQQDIFMTKRIREAAKMVDMDVLDHIIIAEKTYYSFGDNGLI